MMFLSIGEENLALAKKAASPDELLALAAEHNITLTQDEAEIYFRRLHINQELSEEELENVSAAGKQLSCSWDCPDPLMWRRKMTDYKQCDYCRFMKHDYYYGRMCEYPNAQR
jgi:hypothetical protein